MSQIAKKLPMVWSFCWVREFLGFFQSPCMSKNILGLKRYWVQKICSLKRFWVHKTFGSEKDGCKKLSVKKNLGPKSFCVPKIFWSNQFWVKKIARQGRMWKRAYRFFVCAYMLVGPCKETYLSSFNQIHISIPTSFERI